MEALILGAWTPEEFKDTLIYAAVIAFATFLLTVFASFVAHYLGMR